MSEGPDHKINFPKIEDLYPEGVVFFIYAIDLRSLFRITNKEQKNLELRVDELNRYIENLKSENKELQLDIQKYTQQVNELRELEKKETEKTASLKVLDPASQKTDYDTLASELEKIKQDAQSLRDKNPETVRGDMRDLSDQQESELRQKEKELEEIKESLNELALASRKNFDQLGEKFLASREFVRFVAKPALSPTKLNEGFYITDSDKPPLKFEEATDAEKTVIEDGHQFGIFRGNLKDDWLNSSTQKVTVSDEMVHYVHLSKLGLLQIRTEVKLKDENLIVTLKSLLDSQKRETGKTTETFSNVLKIATEFAKLLNFEEADNFHEFFPDGLEITPRLYEEIENRRTQVERQRYTLLLLNRLRSDKGEYANITPANLHKNAPNMIACLLQGTLLYDDSADSPIYEIPPIKKEVPDDLSTWNDELCLFGPERGLIFYNEVKVYEAGGRMVSYKDYWACVVRGVECTVALRAALHILESKTTSLLKETPEILALFGGNEKALKNEAQKKKAGNALEAFAKDLASILRVLPPLRRICIPSNAFRSGHSIRKFHFLSETCFNFGKTLTNMQTNIDELTNFLTFFKQLQIQIEFDAQNTKESKKSRLLGVWALVFAITSIAYVSASFINDLYLLAKNPPSELGNSYLWGPILIYFVILAIALSAGALLWFKRNNQAETEGNPT
jgi:archaellum component FlaC